MNQEQLIEDEELPSENPQKPIKLTKKVFQDLQVGTHQIGVNKVGYGFLEVSEITISKDEKRKEYHIYLPTIDGLRIVHNKDYLTVFGRRAMNVNVNHIFLTFETIIPDEKITIDPVDADAL